jgi:hypothetical protein
MDNFLRLIVRAQRIDRRILYLLLALCIAVPIAVDVPQPRPVVMPETQSLYNTIESIAKDPVESKKLAIVCTNYSGGTLAENQTQNEAIVRHLMRLKLKFAVFAFATPQGRELGRAVADKLAEEYKYVYGSDYVDLGFCPPDAIEVRLKAAVDDLPGAFEKDSAGAALTSLPIMAQVKTVNDINLIVEVTPSETLPPWLQFFQRAGEKPIPTVYCPTAVMGPEKYPLLKSGQLQGMMLGLRGASEYETLLGVDGFGHRGGASLSLSHLLIILLILLGNLGMFAERRLRRQQGRA